MKVIRNFDQLCEHAGASENTIEALARVVHKAAPCGPLLSLVARGMKEIGKRQARIRAWGSISLYGLVIHSISVNGRRVFSFGKFNFDGMVNEAPVDKPVPQEILTYLYAERHSLTYRTTREAQDAIIACHARGGIGEGFTVCRARTGLAVSFDIDLPLSLHHSGGVSLGAVVEGSERTPETLELLYPFTTEHWDEAIRTLQGQADDIWIQTHGAHPGCPWCLGLAM